MAIDTSRYPNLPAAQAFNRAPPVATFARPAKALQMMGGQGGGAAQPMDPSGLVPVNRVQPMATDAGSIAQRLLENRTSMMPPSSFSGQGAAWRNSPTPVGTGQIPVDLPMHTMDNPTPLPPVYASPPQPMNPNDMMDGVDHIRPDHPAHPDHPEHPDWQARMDARLAANPDWQGRYDAQMARHNDPKVHGSGTHGNVIEAITARLANLDPASEQYAHLSNTLARLQASVATPATGLMGG